MRKSVGLEFECIAYENRRVRLGIGDSSGCAPRFFFFCFQRCSPLQCAPLFERVAARTTRRPAARLVAAPLCCDRRRVNERGDE